MMITLLTVMTMATGQVANATNTDETRTTGTLTVHKFEMEKDKLETGEAGTGLPGQEIPDGAEKLKDVEYTITQTHTYNQATGEWTEFAGTPIKVVTGTDGIAHFPNLNLGRYTVDETGGPAHVNLNPDTFSVDIPMTSADGMSVNYDVHIYPKNETIRGAVKLLKADGENSNAGLAGAEFNLYHANGELVDGGDTLPPTNGDGYIYVDGLAYGNYYFTEKTAPTGYVLQSGQFSFSITKSGTISQDGESTGVVEPVTVTNYHKPDIVKTVDKPTVNRGDTVMYTLTIDLPADIKSYKSFVITDVLHENLTYVAGSADVPVGFTFDDDGQTLTWTGSDFAALEPGQLPITFKAKIAEDATVTTIDNKASIAYKNDSGTTGDKETPPTIVTLTDGGFTVLKVDAADTTKTLAGAKFKLTDESGATIDATGTVIKVNGVAFTGLLENLETGVDGRITIEGLNVGNYELVETEAPTYTENGVEKRYRLRTTPIPVNVLATSVIEDHIVEVENSKSGWELPKTGGFGTTIFTFVGLLLMAGAIYIYTRREKSVVE